MYPSDYDYASNFYECNSNLFNYDESKQCYDDNWIYRGKNQWLLTMNSATTFNSWYIHYSGYIAYKYNYYENFYYEIKKTNTVRTVLYLSPETIITIEQNKFNEKYFVID